MGKYLHLFETTSAFTEAYNGEEYIEPWVSYTRENGHVDYNKEHVPTFQCYYGSYYDFRINGQDGLKDAFEESAPQGLLFLASTPPVSNWLEVSNLDMNDYADFHFTSYESSYSAYTCEVHTAFVIEYFTFDGTTNEKTKVGTTILKPGDTFDFRIQLRVMGAGTAYFNFDDGREIEYYQNDECGLWMGTS